MARGKSKKTNPETTKKEVKQASPVHDEVPSVSSQVADPGDDSEPEFDNIETTLAESLS